MKGDAARICGVVPDTIRLWKTPRIVTPRPRPSRSSRGAMARVGAEPPSSSGARGAPRARGLLLSRVEGRGRGRPAGNAGEGWLAGSGLESRRFGAEGGTRTPTDRSIRPSSVRVYQFHHFGNLGGHSGPGQIQRKRHYKYAAPGPQDGNDWPPSSAEEQSMSRRARSRSHLQAALRSARPARGPGPPAPPTGSRVCSSRSRGPACPGPRSSRTPRA